MSTVATTSASTVDPTSAVQQAAQSIISGSTNSTMDVNSLVTAIVNAKVAGQTDALTAKQTKDNTQLTAVGTLKSVLSLLQSSVSSLADGTTLGAFTATGSGKGLTGTASTGAVAGTYSVAVSNIATSQSLTSTAFTSTAQLGTGTMKLSVGGKDMSISIDSSNNTLAGIASAINKASGNPGITAAVVNGTDGAHLVLRSASTGQANGITVAVTPNMQSDGTTPDDNGLSKLNVASTLSAATTDSNGNAVPAQTAISSSNWTQTTAGMDANFTIAGTPASSSTNAVTTALSGVTLNLTSDAVGTTQTLTIAQDTATQKTAIDGFVTAYNNFITTAASLTSFDSTQAAGSQGGALLGDSMMNTIRNALSSTIAKGVGSGTSQVNLASIGITLQPDGTLKTDEDALTAALSSNSGAVASLFNSSTGVAAQLNNSLTGFLATGGIVDTRTTALTADLSSITDQQTALASYTAQLTTTYNDQFTALNTLMSQMATQGSYLTALFGGTNSAGALASNKS
ncbi:flagellar filament capping protein FliD [Caballeronia sp. LP006]|uniref:flagellar filament capping protein FliD n=1 Tax=unclassified Caballeronia TaxID=2646786 RepID=UPI001FD26249|nr:MULTISPECIES: flagellar filament capping protein FliD [unclassified Caballeronia]MDR5770298.1 flagellar filament capping protein FliD [Caballeronia sp. LZ002]MDR5803303.1 flagellar filament capping protein FliD [Caballeronia sp. LZ001]MDR5830029.1 flagellar filament capping protein FliD [Caballeronia sp. LP006]MDR5845735.1 flagellar filament capping protein FliD [Caballeronia sp. LZ003]